MPADAAPDAALVPALDPAVIAGLRLAQDALGNPEFIAQLVALFQTNAPARLARIREAVAACDGATLGLTAHTLKSSSAMLGARRLAAICGGLERCGDSGALADAARMIEGAEAELARVLAALQEIVIGQKSEVRSQKSE